ncbi:MAG: cytochrome b [Gammaproteobacteria bacterium]
MENQIKKYSLVAIALHWIIAILIIGLFVLGLYMVELPEDVVPSVRKPWFELHKSLGVTVFILLLMRVFWRMTHQPPELPDMISAGQKKLISIVHKLFYVSMFLQPLSGYMSSSFSGYKTKLFGIPLPHWGWKNPEYNEFFTGIHEISAAILFGFIVVHLVGIIKHKLNGDGKEILQRMLP